MAENSLIEWTDHTFNPWMGCTKVGPGCDHCYAEALATTRLGVPWGAGQPRRRTAPGNWAKPRQWNRNADAFAEQHGRKQRVFCASLADVFDNEVDPAWRADLFALIAETPNLDWLLVTKRIGNVAKMLAALGMECLPVNVWLGITVVNQDEADRDIPKLLAVHAPIRFLSIEPLLGAIILRTEWLEALDWAIVGGESGQDARHLPPDLPRSLRDQCAASGVSFLFKQWGEWMPIDYIDGWADDFDYRFGDGSGRTLGQVKPCADLTDDERYARIGKKSAGRLLDGIEHNGYPRQ